MRMNEWLYGLCLCAWLEDIAWTTFENQKDSLEVVGNQTRTKRNWNIL